MQLECFARTETGHVRPSNQDYVGCFPEQGLFVVADGMGGHDAGEVASRMAVESVQHTFENGGEDPPIDRLYRAVAASNGAIFAAGRPDGRSPARPMGTTVVALSISSGPEALCWAHVGDSRLYLSRRNRLRLLTSDHTRYGGRFTGREIPLDLPHTNELLAALGIDESIQPGIGQARWQPGDVYMLCTDGISGLLPPARIRTLLGTDDSVEAIGTNLVEEALEAGGTDNASVVVVRTA